MRPEALFYLRFECDLSLPVRMREAALIKAPLAILLGIDSILLFDLYHGFVRDPAGWLERHHRLST